MDGSQITSVATTTSSSSSPPAASTRWTRQHEHLKRRQRGCALGFPVETSPESPPRRRPGRSARPMRPMPLFAADDGGPPAPPPPARRRVLLPPLSSSRALEPSATPFFGRRLRLPRQQHQRQRSTPRRYCSRQRRRTAARTCGRRRGTRSGPPAPAKRHWYQQLAQWHQRLDGH